MRQGFNRTVIAVFAAVLVMAPGALAATPEDIYKDLADNGRLDGTYTQAELQAFLQNASVQGYGNPVLVTPVVVTPPTTYPCVPPANVQPGQTLPEGQKVCETPSTVAAVAPATPVAAATPEAGVAGVSKTVVSKPAVSKPAVTAAPQPTSGTAGVQTPEQAPLARTASAGTLPFTGAELGLFALVGAALLLGGLALRASARQR